MISASTEPSSSSLRASSTNNTDSSATRLFCGGKSPSTCAAQPTRSAQEEQRTEENLITQQPELSQAYDRPAELVEEARHGDRIRKAEGAGGLALPFAKALLRDVLVVGRLQRGRHAGGGSVGLSEGFGGLRFHGSCRGQKRRSMTGVVAMRYWGREDRGRKTGTAEARCATWATAKTRGWARSPGAGLGLCLA